MILLGAVPWLWSTAAGDTVHMKDGRAIRMGACSEEEREIRCHRAGGVVGIPREQVARIEKEVKQPSFPGPASAQPAPEPASPTGPTIMKLQEDPEEILGRIEELTRVLADPNISSSDSGLARESLAGLHTFLGNKAALVGNYKEAESRYRAALDQSPHMMAARLNLASVLITVDQHGAAEGLLVSVLADSPEDPRAFELLGELSFQIGRLDEAIERWEKAMSIQETARLTERLQKARRLRGAEEGFSQADGAHFALRYDGDEASPELARDVLRYLEEAYGTLSSRLAHYPDAVIQVILYPTRSFHEATQSPDWVGGLFDGQVRIPVRGLSHLTPQARRVLVHELAHSFLASKTRGNVPRWIQEGFAQVLEGRTSASHQAALAEAVRSRNGGVDQEFNYPKALSQVEFLLGTWSQFHLNEVLDHLGRGDDIDAALGAAMGQSYEEFLEAWAVWLTR